MERRCLTTDIMQKAVGMLEVRINKAQVSRHFDFGSVI